MKIEIKTKTIEVPTKIDIDGKDYPIHQWNVNTVREYLLTKDEKVLSKLKDFSLEF